jgi:arabinofuranosyltransferase
MRAHRAWIGWLTVVCLLLLPAAGLTYYRYHRSKTVHLLFLGDLGPEWLAEPLSDLALPDAASFRRADFLIGNLGTRLSPAGDRDRATPAPDAWPADVAKRLRRHGFAALSLAQRELAAAGGEALVDTIGHLNAANVKAFGAGNDLAQARKPLILHRHGRRVGLLAAAEEEFESEPLAAAEGRPGFNPLRLATLRHDIAALHRKTQTTIVLVRWQASSGQVTAARQDLTNQIHRAGADLVIGYGAPTLQRIEAQGQGLTLFSLNAAGAPADSPFLAAGVSISPVGVETVDLWPLQRERTPDGWRLRPLGVAKTKQVVTPLLHWVRNVGEFHGDFFRIEGERVRTGAGTVRRIVTVYLRHMADRSDLALLLCGVPLLVGALLRRSRLTDRRWFRASTPWFVLAAAVFVGLALAWRYRALYDDAYISLRYARNWLAGHGLVYNLGERVEGYTNFLWTVLVAVVSKLTGRNLPLTALTLNLVCLVGNLLVVFWIGRRLNRGAGGAGHFPLAVAWLSANYVFTCYGTSGMETMCASLLVNAAILVGLLRTGALAAFGGGAFLVLATLTRPDHALFYAGMGAVLTLEKLATVIGAWRRRAPVKPCLRRAGIELGAYALPLAGYAGYLAWKYHYYGSLVPNTYYAKSVELSYWGQGLRYVLISGLAMQLVLLLPMWLLWAVLDRDPGVRRFKRVTVLAVALFTLYIVKIGGDFMLGRFLVSLTPLVLLGVERWLHVVARGSARRPAAAAIVVTALLACTVYGARLVAAGRAQSYIADESTYYHVTSLAPLIISASNGPADRLGGARLLYRCLARRGLVPVIATGGIGQLGYYSRLPLVDLAGLTDAVVARRPLSARSRPGHEKGAPPAYLDYRQVRLMRGGATEQQKEYVQFRIAGRSFGDIFLYRYEGALMDRIARDCREFRFTRFPTYLDKNTPRLAHGDALSVAQTLREFDHYYFSLNDDPARRRPFVDRFVQLIDFEDGRYPPGGVADGAFARALVRPAFDLDFDIEEYQGETLVATPAGGQGRLALPPFTVQGDTLGFLLGGKGGEQTSVRLLVDDVEIQHAAATSGRRLRFVTWNVAEHRGRKAQLVLEDRSDRHRLLFDMFFEAEKVEQEVDPAP